MRSSRYTSSSEVAYALKNISFENSALDVLPDKILHRAGYLYPYLETVSFKNSTVTNMSYIAETSSSGFSFLEHCTGLKNLDLTGMDFSTLYSGSKFLYGCNNLENVVFPADLRIATGSLNFRNATNLTKESLLSLLNSINEQSTQKTLYLGEINTEKLTAEEIAIATEKG